MESDQIEFCVKGKEVLKITKDGFHYNGEIIKDAGEAHKAWMDVMKRLKTNE